MIQSNRFSKKWILYSAGLLILCSFLTIPRYTFAQREAAEDLRVLAGWYYFKSAPDDLYSYLSGKAYHLLAQRNSYVQKINTLEGWKQQQQRVRKTLMDIVGPFPEKTPLNARVTAQIEKENYRVENIVFESQPGFYVTSTLFIPKNLKPGQKAPAILYPSGHSGRGYRSGPYQHLILNLVNKGFIVYAWDPFGQGERLQYFDADSNKTLVGPTTREHSYAALQPFLIGSSTAKYVIWDGIRAVDYLLTRKEVDPSRIGMTGRSGGGFQSLYIPAFDDRIYATAPENHVANYTRILQKQGPRDGEQSLFHMFENKIDHPDFLTARAPRPALIVATTNDMFNIDGTRETFNEVSKVYQAYGKKDDFKMVEDIAPHVSTQKNNEAIYAFFQKYLNNPGSSKDEHVERLSEDELKVTKTGQVSTSLNSETIFSINQRQGDKLAVKLKDAWGKGMLNAAQIVKSAKEKTGYRDPDLTTDKPVMTGSVRRDGYTIEKYFIKGEGDYPIPYLLMVPERSNHKAVIYINPSGKGADAGKDGKMEWFVKKGFTVLSPDIIGTGEVGPGDFKGEKNFGHAVNEGLSFQIWHSAAFIGRSILGVRTSDVVKLAGLLKKEKATKIYAVTSRRMCPVLLHAAAFTNNIDGIALIEPYASYLSIIDTRYYNPSYLEGFVPGALQAYDLPYLAASVAPRRIIMQNVKAGSGKEADSAAVRAEYAVASELYKSKGATDNFIIAKGDSEEYVFSELIKN